MNELTKVELSANAETAAALQDEQHGQVAAQIVEEVTRPRRSDPLAAVLRAIAAEARAAGWTDADTEAELAAYNAERRT